MIFIDIIYSLKKLFLVRDNKYVIIFNHVLFYRFRVRMGPGIFLYRYDRSQSYNLQVPIDRNYSTICNAKQFNFRRGSELLLIFVVKNTTDNQLISSATCS